MKQWLFEHRVAAFLIAISVLVVALVWPGWLVNSWQVWQAKKALSPVIEHLHAYQREKGNYPDKIDQWLPANLPLLLRKTNDGGLIYHVPPDHKGYSLEFPKRENLQPRDREYIKLYIYTDREGWIYLQTLRDRSERP